MSIRQRKKSYLAMLLTLAIAVSLFSPIEVKAATWKQDHTGWWWQKDDGSYPSNCWESINGKWYYFDANGYMETGWLLDNGYWYYLGADGAMVTGWQLINNVYYYFYNDGHMAADTYIDTYYVDASGAWIPDSGSGQWLQVGSLWWYRHADGSYTRNAWEKIDDDWYYFDAEGWMVTGWMEINGDWYYFDATGAMVTGWVEVNGDWYYLDESGAMATDQWIGDYYVDSTGLWIPNTHIVDLGNGQYDVVGGTYVDAFEAEVIALVNEYRAANGLNTLSTDTYLSEKTDIRGYEISYSFSHTRPNGESCFTVVDDGTYRAMGENIAMGYQTPEAVFEGWKNSPGHNANMLNENFTLIGVSCFAVEEDWGTNYYWVQLFATE